MKKVKVKARLYGSDDGRHMAEANLSSRGAEISINTDLFADKINAVISANVAAAKIGWELEWDNTDK